MYREFKKQLITLCGGQPRALLVALSGGSDSVTLLSLCLRLRKETGVCLHALHFNHHIRGEEAERDASFCAELCKAQAVAFHLAEADIPALAQKSGMGLEECGRQHRYAALEEVRVTEGLDYILTAHNADDVLETLLFRIARGTGLKGLSGIPSKNGVILRPMLSFTKEQIEDFCKENSLCYVTDSSNADKNYHRNRIRSEAVPALKKVRSDVTVHALALCQSLAEDESFISSMLPAGRADAALLESLHPALLKRYIVREYHAYLGTLGRSGSLEAVHITAVTQAVRAAHFGAAFSLPGFVKVTYTVDGFHFAEGKAAKQAYHIPLLPGENPIPGLRYSIFLGDHQKFSEFSAKKTKIHNLFIQLAGKNDTIEGLFYMRSRLSGDRIRFGGMTREISKLVAAKTADPQIRQQYPLICDGAGILWLPGYPKREDDGEMSSVKNDKNTIYLWIGEKTS